MNLEIPYPVILKPARLGSSIGIKVCYGSSELNEKIDLCSSYDGKILAQKYIQNFREFNQAIYRRGEQLVLSKVEEVFKHHDIFDFHDKYLGTKINDKHQFLDLCSLVDQISTLSSRIYQLFDLSGVVRIDYLLDENGQLYVNEVNTTPGSLAYYLFDMEGLDFVEDLVREALRVFRNKKELRFNSPILEHHSSLKNG